MAYNPFRPTRPNQTPIPSQAPSRGVPYAANAGQADMAQMRGLQKDHPAGFGGLPPTFVVSTFDARPINGVDFQCQSGENAGGVAFPDYGFNPNPAVRPATNYRTSSVFYTVGPSRVAIVRGFHILCIPARGTDQYGFAAQPIFAPNGESNFYFDMSILVNGVYQEGVAGIRSLAAPFGDVFGECYVVANEGDVIEFRIEAPEDGGSRWYQALLSLHGNLIYGNGNEPQFSPGTQQAIPVHENGTIALKGASA